MSTALGSRPATTGTRSNPEGSGGPEAPEQVVACYGRWHDPWVAS
jgi:hypothetical protein